MCIRDRFKRVDGDTNSWGIVDSARSSHNPITNEILYADQSVDESGISTGINFLSNGYKIHNAGGHINASNKYIYIAFAETPLNFANAR